MRPHFLSLALLIGMLPVQVTELPVPAGASTVYFCETFEVTNDLSDFVGRILTIHSGPT